MTQRTPALTPRGRRGATCSSRTIDLVAVGSYLYASVVGARQGPVALATASVPYDVRQVTESSACCSVCALVGDTGAPAPYVLRQRLLSAYGLIRALVKVYAAWGTVDGLSPEKNVLGSLAG